MEGRRESSVSRGKEASEVGRARPCRPRDFGLRGKGKSLKGLFRLIPSVLCLSVHPFLSFFFFVHPFLSFRY